MSSLPVNVVRITEIEPHPNADRLAITHVKGWQCIIGKDDFKLGDLAIYIPPDAVLPEEMVKRYNLSYLKNNERVKTIKLRGVVSQGLLLPIPPDAKWREGQDVAGILGIKKWEPPQPTYALRGVRRASAKEVNPYFFKYTDIENYKHYPDVFVEGDPIIITEKIHGTNFRVGLLPYHPSTWLNRLAYFFGRKYQYCVGSHNVQIKVGHWRRKSKGYYGANVWEAIANRYQLHRILKPGMILFGEIYGGKPKIQDLTYGLHDDIDVVFFDAVVDNGRFMLYDDFLAFCQSHNLPTVPLLYRGPYEKGIIERFTDGISLLAAPRGIVQIREGVVVRDEREVQHPKIGRKILKSISVDYLLRKDATEYH